MRLAIKKHMIDFLAIAGLAIVGIAIAVYLLSQQDFRFPLVEAKPKHIYVELENSQAVQPGQGQTVRVAGVEVGRISDVKLEDGKAVVGLEIKPGYKSLIREGCILSLSNWRDEKSLVRWRTRRRHHEVQQKGRDEILADYHLRVGQITADNQVPPGCALTEQRLDETEVGEGTTVTLINATRPAEWKQTNNPYDCAEWLGLNPWAADHEDDWDDDDEDIPLGVIEEYPEEP